MKVTFCVTPAGIFTGAIGSTTGGWFGASTVTPNCTLTGGLMLSVTVSVTVAAPAPAEVSAIVFGPVTFAVTTPGASEPATAVSGSPSGSLAVKVTSCVVPACMVTEAIGSMAGGALTGGSTVTSKLVVTAGFTPSSTDSSTAVVPSLFAVSVIVSGPVTVAPTIPSSFEAAKIFSGAPSGSTALKVTSVVVPLSTVTGAIGSTVGGSLTGVTVTRKSTLTGGLVPSLTVSVTVASPTPTASSAMVLGPATLAMTTPSLLELACGFSGSPSGSLALKITSRVWPFSIVTAGIASTVGGALISTSTSNVVLTGSFTPSLTVTVTVAVPAPFAVSVMVPGAVTLAVTTASSSELATTLNVAPSGSFTTKDTVSVLTFCIVTSGIGSIVGGSLTSCTNTANVTDTGGFAPSSTVRVMVTLPGALAVSVIVSGAVTLAVTTASSSDSTTGLKGSPSGSVTVKETSVVVPSSIVTGSIGVMVGGSLASRTVTSNVRLTGAFTPSLIVSVTVVEPTPCDTSSSTPSATTAAVTIPVSSDATCGFSGAPSGSLAV